MTTLRGGDKMGMALARLASKLKQKGAVDVGFLEGATYPDGTSVPMVAAIQEFGAPSQHIPSRPFFRSMIAEKSPSWGADLAKQLKATDYDTEMALGRMGIGIKGQLQKSIVATNSPPLAPATIAAKGNAKPLIDTGHMLNSVDYKVRT